MQYMLLITVPADGTQTATPEAWTAYTNQLMESGAMVSGAGLQGAETATTVRVRDGETLVTDGPFAETKEQLGGYYVLDCENLDETLAYAAKIPAAENGSIEVRPVWMM